MSEMHHSNNFEQYVTTLCWCFYFKGSIYLQHSIIKILIECERIMRLAMQTCFLI